MIGYVDNPFPGTNYETTRCMKKMLWAKVIATNKGRGFNLINVGSFAVDFSDSITFHTIIYINKMNNAPSGISRNIINHLTTMFIFGKGLN